ncbi:MAG: YbaB/EbfC family nucleoid-associated protein [bacterium]
MSKWQSHGGMGGSIPKLIKDAQRAQEELAKIQKELAQIAVEGSSGGGAVKVKLNGQYQPLEVKITSEAITTQDPELLEDLVFSALCNAYDEIKQITEEKMKRLSQGGLSLW